MPSDVAVRVQKAISEKVFPGCVIGVVRSSGEREIASFGHFTYDAQAPEVIADTIYDIASVTKSIPTASLVLMLVGEGTLKLSDPIKMYLPELQNDYDATIEDLLQYRVRGAQLSHLRFSTFEEIHAQILETGFSGPPGAHVYTNLPAYLLGIVIERMYGDVLPVMADRHIFGPLSMTDTTFFPQDIPRIAPTEIEGGQVICGIVHDESARVFARARRAVGHAGLFSTASDILNFLQALLLGKFPHVVEGAQRGLGWQLSQRSFMGLNCGNTTFGKTGFTGTSVVCDIDRGLGLVIFSNRTFPKRPPDATSPFSAINLFRSDIADIVLR